jgi:hypothetical protein
VMVSVRSRSLTRFSTASSVTTSLSALPRFERPRPWARGSVPRHEPDGASLGHDPEDLASVGVRRSSALLSRGPIVRVTTSGSSAEAPCATRLSASNASTSLRGWVLRRARADESARPSCVHALAGAFCRDAGPVTRRRGSAKAHRSIVRSVCRLSRPGRSGRRSSGRFDSAHASSSRRSSATPDQARAGI